MQKKVGQGGARRKRKAKLKLARDFGFKRSTKSDLRGALLSFPSPHSPEGPSAQLPDPSLGQGPPTPGSRFGLELGSEGGQPRHARQRQRQRQIPIEGFTTSVKDSFSQKAWENVFFLNFFELCLPSPCVRLVTGRPLPQLRCDHRAVVFSVSSGQVLRKPGGQNYPPLTDACRLL